MVEYIGLMIFGIGTDIIDIRRIERLMAINQRSFLDRVFTTAEVEYCTRTNSPAHRFAKRFAAKEAFFKALGSGFSDGVTWKDVEILNNIDKKNKPEIFLTGRALEKIKELAGDYRIFLSLSDDYPYAVAYVLIEVQ